MTAHALASTLLFMTVGLCVQGQAAVAASEPCALPVPPTVQSCWNCFQSLLSDCDDQNPEGERRQASYEGANTFLNWCLGEVGDPEFGTGTTDSTLNFNLNKGTDWDVRSNLEIEMRVASITTDEHPAVYVRLQNGEHAGSMRLRQVQYWVAREMHGNDPMMRIIIDTSSIDIEGNSSVGIVVALEHEGSFQNGFAFVADVEDSFDLNRDGVFDFNDRFDAMSRYAAGELDHTTAVRIITAR